VTPPPGGEATAAWVLPDDLADSRGDRAEPAAEEQPDTGEGPGIDPFETPRRKPANATEGGPDPEIEELRAWARSLGGGRGPASSMPDLADDGKEETP
jgi:hypothetical protein